jgi:hypothetical protein
MNRSIHFFCVTFLTAYLLTFIPASLRAVEKPQAANKPGELTALLDDETICVVHVDFTRIDTDAALSNARTLVEGLCDTIGLTQTDREALRASLQPPGDAFVDWNKNKAWAKAGKAFLVDTLGVRDAYLVVQSGGRSFPALAWAAIPKYGKLNAAVLSTLLKQNHCLVRETNDFCFVAMISPWLEIHLDAANLGPDRQAERPEFLAARQAVWDYPVQVFIAPPRYVKKVFREVRPTLPGRFEDIDIAAMPGALRWAAIGVNPEKLEFLLVAEAESEGDAQLLYRNGSELFARMSDELLSALRKNKDAPRGTSELVPGGQRKPAPDADPMPEDMQFLAPAYPAIINEGNLKQLGQFLIPRPEGKRFVVKASGDLLQKAVENLTAEQKKMIREAIPRAKSAK